jgi:hypothetical protein
MFENLQYETLKTSLCLNLLHTLNRKNTFESIVNPVSLPGVFNEQHVEQQIHVMP